VSKKSPFAWLGQIVYRLREGITLSNAAFGATIERVNGLAESTSKLTDGELRSNFENARRRLRSAKDNNKKPLDAQRLNIEALAIVREAAYRNVAMRPYDVQILAAVALLANKCVEMQTGEGKTVTSLRDATFTADGIDLEAEGLRGPSSTWTFMINDNPRGTVLNLLIQGVLSRLKKSLG
jgi:hypothetical protein